MTTFPDRQFSVALMPNFVSSPLRIFLSVSLAVFAALPVSADLLKGTATKEDRLNPGGNGMTLDRHEIMKMGDPFGGNNQAPPAAVDQPFDPGNFALPTSAMPAPPSQPLRGNAQDQGSPFQGQYGQGMPAQEQAPPQQMHNLNAQTGGPPPQQFNPNDPDSSPELQIAWNEWHRRVAEAVYQRYATLANTAFYHSPPMAAAAAYVVTRDGHIVNTHLTQKNGNPIFNAIILAAINSLNGNVAILAFPQGSHRMSVDKNATFTQNYGPAQGFKYQMGDQERIPQQQRRR